MSASSGREIGEKHVATLSAYLERLEAEGEPLPARNGRANLSAIAIACGFDRQTLYKNPAAKALLEKAGERFRHTTSNAEHSQEPELTPKADRRDRRILQLEQHNAALRAEVRALREKIIRFQNIEGTMILGRGVRY